ncbi:MAG: isoprenylcysteine carboxylmethyltransferase family protein [Candidatus Thorarchaeota archaeon]
MADDLIYRALFVGIYALFFGVRGYYRFVKPKRNQTDQDESEPERKKFGIAESAISIFILGFLFSTILYIIGSPWIDWPQIPSYSIWLRLLGILLALASIPLLAWIHRTLDRQYSACLQIKSGHQLISTGPYARVRHPMYTVFSLFSVGIALLTGNLLIITFSLMLMFSFPWIAKKEEQMMIETFGDEYREYMTRTGRFFPKI